MDRRTARLTLDLPADLHKELKILAAQSGLTMREYCERAIRTQLRTAPKPLTAREAPELAELWDNEDDAVYDDL